MFLMDNQNFPQIVWNWYASTLASVRICWKAPNCNSNGKVVTGCYPPAASFALFYSGKQLESLQCIRPRKQRLWPSSLEEFRLQEHPPDPHLTDRKVKAISQGQTILPLHSWACTAKDHLHQAKWKVAVWQHGSILIAIWKFSYRKAYLHLGFIETQVAWNTPSAAQALPPTPGSRPSISETNDQ